MKFIKFDSIENSYKKREIERVYSNNLHGGLWNVTEKIDGANFAVYVSPEGDVSYASRNQFVDGNFFNCEEAVNKYHPTFLSLHDSVRCETVIVRGELYGKGIQNRVNYGESKDFRVFSIDLVIDGEPCPTPLSIWTKWLEMANESKDNPLLPVPILATGLTFEQALEFEEEFSSKLSPDGSKSEGLIISTEKISYFPSGSRIIFKKKSKLFREKRKVEKPAIKATENDVRLMTEVGELLNESRIMSAASKVGGLSFELFGDLMREVMSDILSEFDKCPYEQADNPKLIKSFTQKAASTLVRETIISNT